MTREDAIYEIKQLAVLSTNKNIERITEALNMAIEALQDEIWKDEPNSSEKPNNCEEPQIFICPIQDDYEALIEDEPQTDCGKNYAESVDEIADYIESAFGEIIRERKGENTDCDHKCVQTEVGCEQTDCPWK